MLYSLKSMGKNLFSPIIFPIIGPTAERKDLGGRWNWIARRVWRDYYCAKVDFLNLSNCLFDENIPSVNDLCNMMILSMSL